MNRINLDHYRAMWAAALVGLALLAGNAHADENAAPGRLQWVGLPNIETLVYESDYTVFLRPGVPLEIHRAALRKLWSFPAFRVTDGLTDYSEDLRHVVQRPDDAHLVQSETRGSLANSQNLGRE